MINTTLAHYKITTKLGQGGMGAVYRAMDTKLDREVAIKVLPEEFAKHPERLARFEREAKALAKLNHPNIGSIYGFDQHEGLWFLVLELIEGEDLSERLKRGPLPVEEALKVFQQIAAALEAAHDKGIVHRDLKPGNIKIDSQGRVKVLDFGLAKARLSSGESMDSSGSTADSMAPTITSDFTLPGKVMGTAAYMSPEQSRGQEVDKRTDVWAFGCCLYEALTGRRPFKGATTSDLLAEILKSDPDFTVIPPETPSEVLTLLRRCLEKEPRRRLRDLGDIAITLEETSSPSRTGAYSAPPTTTGITTKTTQSGTTQNWVWPVLTALGAALLVAGFFLWRGAKAPAVAQTNIRSLAVLPFTFETQDPKLSGLGKWIPAEIRSKLGPLQNLQVVNSPARIEQLVQQKKSEVEIARELGVDGLVMGELHGQGETLSAYVSVVDGSTGRALGKQREIASAATKVSELPNQVALAIVDELKLQLSASQRAEIQVADTQNSEAFLTFQRGQDLFSRRLFDEAAVELRRALQLDTNYTGAWNFLAASEWAPLIFGGTTNEMATTFKRLSGEAERLHTQRPNDPSLASTRMWIAMVFERDWNKVRTTFWESQRNPNPNPGPLHAMSYYYTFIEGHPEHALRAVEQAGTLEPENLIYQIDRGYQLAYFGRYDEAARVFRALPPENIQREDYSFVLLMAGDAAGAKEVATRVLAGRPNARTQANLAAIHAKSGAPDEARKILRELEAQAEQGMHIPYAAIASSYGMLGDFESARRWLRRGLREGHGDWTMLTLRTAISLEIFGKLAWYWEIIDEMNFPPLQMDHPDFALEQRMRCGVGRNAPADSADQGPVTLAVLPFEMIGSTSDDAGVGDGMAIDLINALSGIDGLRVTSHAESGRYEDSQTSPATIARDLGVDHILKSHLTMEGNTLRVNAELIDAGGKSIPGGSWRYDEQANNLLSARTSIAIRLTEALSIKLGHEDAKSLKIRPTDNPEAHKQYMQGLAFWHRRTTDDLKKAIAYFHQATSLDTNFARAYAGLADSHLQLTLYEKKRVREHLEESVRLANKAIQLDPTIAEPHATLGHAKFVYEWDWSAAEKHFRAAQLLDPNFSHAFRWHGEALVAQGRFDEALEIAKQAVRLEDVPISHTLYPMVLTNQEEFDEAIDYLEKRISEEPTFRMYSWQLVWAYALSEDLVKALAVVKQMKSRDYDIIGFESWILALMGETEEARQHLGELEEEHSTGEGQVVLVALALHALGEDEKALDQLETLLEERGPIVDFFMYQVAWKKLYSHPRYQAILRKLNLLE